jgi:hypothetical protein
MAKYELSLTVENANLDVTPEGPVTLSVLELVGPRGETGPTGPTGPAGTTEFANLEDVDTSNASLGNLLRADGDGTFSFVSVSGVSDDLDDVTTRGGTTTNDISVGALTATSLNTHTIPSGTGTLAKVSDIPTNNNQLTNGAGYVTEAEAQAAISVVDAGGDGSLTYSSGTITYTGPSAAEVRAHLSAGGDLSYNSATGQISFTERTDGEVRQLLSVSGDLSYNSTTGVFSFTERTDAEVRGLVSATDAGGDGSFSYDNSTGVFTYTGPSAAEVRAHLSAGGDLSYDSATGVISFTERTDAEVRQLFSVAGDLSYNNTTGVFSFTERTDAEVRQLFSVAGDLSYNGTTGEFSFTERTDAEVRGLVSASGDLSYDSSTGVFSFTERTDAEVRGLVGSSYAGGDGSFSYNSSTGVFTYTGPSAAEVRAHLSAGGDLSYNSSTGVMSFTERTDAEVRGLFSVAGDLSYNSTTGQFSFTERTDAEVRGLVSASGDLSYNNTTGVFSFTERTDAEVRGLVSASGDLSYNSTTGVFSFTERTDAEVQGLITGGTGVTVTNGVVAIGQAVNTNSNVAFNDVTVSGDLTVSGTTTTINTETINLADNQITLNSNYSGSTPTENAGIEVNRGGGTAPNKTLVWNETDDKWTIGSETFVAGTVEADVTGNADTASALATSRTISLGGDVSGSTTFDGSSEVTITATVADDSHNHIISNVDGLQTALDGKLASVDLGYTTAASTGVVTNDSGANATIPAATTTTAGLLTSSDKTKLDGIEAGATADQTQSDINALGITATGLSGSPDISVGNITVSGTVDGRDVATDGSKLDAIEALADVTDATNVAAAGAVMESDTSTVNMSFVIDEDTMASDSDTKVPTQQSVKAYVDANAGGGGTLNDVVDDTTPQLGGSLDVNGNSIVSVSGGDIAITPDADGQIVLDGLNWPISDGTDRQVLVTDGSGELTFDDIPPVQVDATNNTASAIAAGTPVYQTGVSGQNITIAPADASSASTMPAIGVTKGSISASGGTGVVVVSGFLKGINTSTYAAGDTLYVANGGGFATSPPAGETVLIENLGKVVKSDASAGSIIVTGAGRANAVPNLNDGRFFLGNDSNQAGIADFTTSVRGEVSATKAGGDGSLSYNSGTGVFTYTGPSADETREHFTGGTGVTITDGEVAIGQAVGTADNVEFGNATLSGYLAGPATFTIDPAAVGDDTGKVVIAGDLQVDGTTTTINSTTLSVDDMEIVVADGAADGPTADQAGIKVDGANATLHYRSTGDMWQTNKSLDVNGNATLSGASTEARSLTIGDGRTGNGYSLIDLVGDNSGDYGLRLIRQNNGENAASIIRHTGTGPLRLKTEDSGDILFDTASTERMRINSTGNVGIGTTSPTEKLQVNGNIKDSVGNVRIPRRVSINTDSTIENEGVYYTTLAPTLTLGDPVAGAILTIYNNSNTAMTLNRGSDVGNMRIAADNALTNNTSVTLGAYSTTTITIFIGQLAVVSGTDVS